MSVAGRWGVGLLGMEAPNIGREPTPQPTIGGDMAKRSKRFEMKLDPDIRAGLQQMATEHGLTLSAEATTILYRGVHAWRRSVKYGWRETDDARMGR